MSGMKVTTLLSNATVDETSGAASPLNTSRWFNVTVEWGAGSSAGVVAIETAPHKDYAGTWSNLTSFTWAVAESVDVWRGNGPMGAIRARITTAITTTDKGVTVTLTEN